MRKLLLTFGLLCLSLPALAQAVLLPDNTINCAYNTVSPVLTAGQMGRVQCDSSGAIILAPTSGPLQVVGNIARGATDSGNPVKTGGVYNATPTLLTEGLRGNTQVGTRGATWVQIMGPDTVSATVVTTAGTDNLSNSRAGLDVYARGNNFNGTAWDRAFTCPTTAAISVAAGTSQIVALSGTTVIYVCSYAVAISLTGSFKFIYGTGADCVTSPADITAAMPITTATPFGQSIGSGSLFRGLAANALCLTATTGTITGYVTYARF